MEAIIKKVLDTSRIYKGEPIVAVTNDKNSRFIQAVICTDGVPNYVVSSEAVIVTYERADGTSKTYNGTSNADGSVKVPIASWSTEEEGDVYGWITVGTGAAALSTTKFVIEVQYRPDTGGEVSEDDPEYDDIMDILAKLNEHTQKLDLYQEQISENAKEVSSVASVASANRKRIANLEGRLGQSASVTDDAVAYAMIVPEGALPYAEVTKIGGMSYRDEATGTLKNASVTGVKITGANLLNVDNNVNVSRNGITIVSNGDGSITVNGTATAEFAEYIGSINIKNLHGTFTTSGLNEGFYQLYDKDGNYVNDLIWGNGNFEILESQRDYRFVQAFIYIYKDSKYNNAKFYPMINAGSTALPYESYRSPTTFPISADVQALNGYGLGVNSACHSFIDLQNKIWNEKSKSKQIKSAKEFEFRATEDGTFYTVVGYIGASNHIISGRAYPLVCNKYASTLDNDPGKGVTGCAIAGNGAILIYDKLLQTKEEWQAQLDEWTNAGSPLEIIYAIKTIVTDISDLLSDDNFIEVSEGGLAIAENANGLGVPTTITYQIKEDAEGGSRMISTRLIKKNRPFDEKSFQSARRRLIEDTVKQNGYPTNGSEIAILRKQMRAILDALKSSGIDAELPEFAEYNRSIETNKSAIDSELNTEKGEV